MNKSDLVAKLAAEHGISKRLAKQVVDLIFEAMAKAMVDGERIELRGFGSMRLHQYAGYRGRNPRTGEPVDVLPKRLPLFRQSKMMEVKPDRDDD